MKKLHAFTLMELLVGMVLSGLVVGAAFTAYEITAKQYGSYQRMNAGIRETAWLHGQLGKDFGRAKLVSGSRENLKLNFPAGGSVQYRFDDHIVLRRDSFVTDTFRVNIKDVQLLLAGKTITGAQQPIDELRIEAELNEEPEQLFFIKTYPAEFWLDRAREEEEQNQ